MGGELWDSGVAQYIARALWDSEIVQWLETRVSRIAQRL